MPRPSIKSYRATGSQAANRRKLYANYAATKTLRRAGYTTIPRSMGVYAAGEMKYFDTERTSSAVVSSATNAGTQAVPNVGTPNTLCVPVVGSAINQRIGRKVNVHRIVIKGAINVPPQTAQSAADVIPVIRLSLVQDMQTNSAQATGTDWLQSVVSASSTQAIQGFQSLNNLGRFKVIKDKIINLQNPNMANDAAATGNIVQAALLRQFKFVFKPKTPVSVSFNSTNGGTISDVVDNSWSVYANCSSTAMTPAIYYVARCYYKE